MWHASSLVESSDVKSEAEAEAEAESFPRSDYGAEAEKLRRLWYKMMAVLSVVELVIMKVRTVKLMWLWKVRIL